jgi:seryl-tRNA synthetase
VHDIKFFEEQTQLVKTNLEKRNFDTSVVDEALELNKMRKDKIKLVEQRRAQVKLKSKEIGALKKKGEDASSVMKEVAKYKAENIADTEDLEAAEAKLNQLLMVIPNLISDEVPLGKTEDDNKILKEHGEVPKFDFTPKDHVDIGENLGMLDLKRAAKVTGARFSVLSGGLAKLERALINFMLDHHAENGFTEFVPPFIVNSESLFGTGQLPKFGEDLFKLENREWYLIPTSEVPLTNLKREELFSGDDLPLKYTAYTPCFRSEAGSHGKDTRGLVRVHQFNKVEMVCITSAEQSEEIHSQMIQSAENILEKLKLPYRTALLCTGDIGFGARKCIDLEVWLPAQDTYREISSISNCWDFQGRRAKIRYRNSEGKPEFAHTLNGSGLAVGRTLVAILENYQNEDGSVTIPEVLRPYMGQASKISK